MGVLKNGVGRPSNEVLRKRKLLLTIFFIIIAIIFGVIMYLIGINYLHNDTNENFYTIEMTGDKVNEELKNVYAFRFLEDDKKIIALTTGNKKITIASNVDNIHSISYDDGKIYYNYDIYNENARYGSFGGIIEYIDLTKGNGKYKKEYIIINKNDINMIFDIQVVNKIIYYTDFGGDSYIWSYDINNKKLKKIDGGEEGGYGIYASDKKYNKLYYSSNDGDMIEYDINSKKKNKIYKYKSGLEFRKKSNHIIEYTKVSFVSDGDWKRKVDIPYNYDIKSGKTTKLSYEKEYDLIEEREIFYID